MSIALRSTNNGDSTPGGGNFTIALPAGTQSTDVVIVAFSAIKLSAATPTITPPSGWTAINSVTQSATGTVIGEFAFRALGSVSNLTFSYTNLDSVGWVIASFTGVDNTTPIDVTGTANSNTGSASISAATMTIATSGAWVIIGATDLNFGTFSATGFTGVQNDMANEPSTLLYKSGYSTGATGSISISNNGGSGGQAMAITPFALRPAGAAASSTLPWLAGYLANQ